MKQKLQAALTPVLRSQAIAASAFILIALALTGGDARAAGQKGPDPASFLSDFSDRALAMLTDESLSDAEREVAFGDLFNEGFDVRLIARFVLGRFWRSAEPQQREEYRDLFESYTIATYARRIKGLSGEFLEVGEIREETEKRAIVASRVVRPESEPISVDWRMRRTEAGWKIVDIEVEGISMAVTQRSEFTSVITNNGGKLEALMGKLREQTKTKVAASDVN